jgi:hypothetical protein
MHVRTAARAPGRIASIWFNVSFDSRGMFRSIEIET